MNLGIMLTLDVGQPKPIYAASYRPGRHHPSRLGTELRAMSREQDRDYAVQYLVRLRICTATVGEGLNVASAATTRLLHREALPRPTSDVNDVACEVETSKGGRHPVDKVEERSVILYHAMS
jgi:hypothetical protein